MNGQRFLIANSVTWLDFEQRIKSNFLRRILFCFEWLSQSRLSFPRQLAACTILNVNSDSKPGRKSNAFTHHTVVGMRFLRLLSCPLFSLYIILMCLIFFQHQHSQYLAHSMCTSLPNMRASNRRIVNSFGDVWYNIVVIEMLPNRHAFSLGFELPLHFDLFRIWYRWHW